MALKKTTKWALLGLMGLTLVLSVPAYIELRKWRAHNMAKEAERLLNSPENIGRAWELAHAAQSLNPDDPEIARTLARVYSANDPAAAHRFWETTVALSESLPEDRVKLAKAYLHANLWEQFDTEIEKQRDDGLHPEQLRYLEALSTSRQGDFEEALEILISLVTEENAPEEADTLFFQITRLYKEPEIRRAGIDHLWRVIDEGGSRKHEAITTIAGLPEVGDADIERLIRTIREDAASTRPLKLLAHELSLRLSQVDPSSVFSETRQLFDLFDPLEMAEFGRWLNQNGLSLFTSQAIPIERAKSRQDLFLILLDAMALEKEWQSIKALLSEPRIPLETYLKAFFEARVLIEIGSTREASLAWNKALAATRRDNTKLYFLAQMADRLDLVDFQISALQRMIDSPTLQHRAFTDLISALQAVGDSDALQTTLQKYTEYFPEDKSGLNDSLYLKFLTQSASEQDLDHAMQLLQANPNILAYRITLVLGLLNEGRADEAIRLLNKLPVNWFEVRDRWRLIAAIALHRTGFEDDALTFASQTNSRNLLPEERELLEEIVHGKPPLREELP